MTTATTSQSIESAAVTIITDVNAAPYTFEQESIGRAIGDLFDRTKEFLDGLVDHNEQGIDILSENAYKRFARDYEYTQLYRLRTMVPEGFNDYFTHYIETLHQIQDFIDPLIKNSLGEFEQYIAQLLNQPERLESSRHSQLMKWFNDRDIEEQKKIIAKHFDRGESEFRVYGDVIENQKSWMDIVSRYNDLIGRLQLLPMKDVFDAVKRIEDLLDALAKRIQNNSEQYSVSGVTTKDIAALTTAVAQEVEFYATHRFMVQNLRTAFEYARVELPQRIR